MTSIRWQVPQRFALAIGMLAVLAGCPVPLPPAYESASRQNVGERLPEFIIRGQTTREDVLLALGEPDGTGPNANWLAWGSARGKGGVAFSMVPFGAWAAFGTMVTEYRRVIVTFDERDLVSEAKYDTTTCPLLFIADDRHGAKWSDPCLDITGPEAAKRVSLERATPTETSSVGQASAAAPVQAFADETPTASEAAVIETEPDPASMTQRGALHYIQGIDGRDAGEMTRRVRVAAGERSITVLRSTAIADLPPTLSGLERGCAALRASVAAGGTYLIGSASSGAVTLTDARTTAVVAVAVIEPGTFMNSRCPPK